MVSIQRVSVWQGSERRRTITLEMISFRWSPLLESLSELRAQSGILSNFEHVH